MRIVEEHKKVRLQFANLLSWSKEVKRVSVDISPQPDKQDLLVKFIPFAFGLLKPLLAKMILVLVGLMFPLILS